jgi:hypothetical protein
VRDVTSDESIPKIITRLHKLISFYRLTNRYTTIQDSPELQLKRKKLEYSITECK